MAITDPELEARLDAWRVAASAFNTVAEAITTPEFEQVVQNGDQIAPLLVQRLRDEGWLWHLPLCAIFGETVEVEGHVAEADAWLDRLSAA